MKLIIGLGNPEDRYKNTRHNIGFRVVSKYAAKMDTEFKLKEKFKASIAELSVDGKKIMLAMPITYYNNVGESARHICDFYKIPVSNVLIIHDELALPFGTIRTRIGGSDAGNNGVKSISNHLGPDTARIRIGIYNELRDQIDDADFVLGNFSHPEDEKLPEILDATIRNIDSFIADNFTVTTHQ